MTASTAKFTIAGDAYANLGYDALKNAELELQLEDQPALDVRSCVYSVVAQSLDAPNIAELGAPGSAGASPSTPGGALEITMPTTAGHSYLIRCTINGGRNSLGLHDATYTRERIVAIRDGTGTRRIVPSESTQYDATNGWTEAVNDAIAKLTALGFDNRSVYGVAGRQSNSNDTKKVIGTIILPLGDVANGYPSEDRALTFEAVLSTTDAGNTTKCDLYNLTTLSVVGSELTSVSTTGQQLTTTITSEVGTSLDEDTTNIIQVRVAQTTTDAAEQAIVDVARINVDYVAQDGTPS